MKVTLNFLNEKNVLGIKKYDVGVQVLDGSVFVRYVLSNSWSALNRVSYG